MTGLFGELPTPTQRQEATMRKALELRREQWKPQGFYYRGAGDLLLRHGKFYSGRELPEQYQPLMGEEGRCFHNALTAVQTDSSLRYCEGVYATGAGHYTPHAWCLDPGGALLELTLPIDITNWREAHTMLPYLSPESWGYWGIVIHPDYVTATIDAQEGNEGVLDRPIHDTIAFPGHNVDEWRTHWPILTYPYDPQRKTL